MATANDQVNIIFGADTKGLVSGLANVQQSIKSTMAQMSSGFGGVGAALETAFINPITAAIAAVGALSLAIGVAVQKTATMEREMVNFSTLLGINTRDAAGLKDQLEEVGLTTDSYSDAFLKFARQVKNGGSDLEKNFGLKLRDTNGHLRDGNTLFKEALTKVSEYKVGIDQDTVAMALFGRSVADVIRIQKILTQDTEEHKKKMEELGLVVTEKNKVAMEEYVAAMDDAGDVFDGIGKAIGDAFMPILTELANWFASIGPSAIEVTRGALFVLAAAFYSIENAAVTIVAPIVAAMASIQSAAVNAAKAIANVATLDFSAAKNNIKQIGKDTSQAFSEADAKITAQYNKSRNALREILNPDKTASTPKGGGKSAPNLEKKGGGGKNEASQLAEQAINHEKTMQLELLEQKKAIAQSELNLGRITKQQLIQQQIEFENEKYEIERSALEKRAQLAASDPNSSPAAKQKALDQILELERKHQTEVLKLQLQSSEEAQKYNTEAVKSIEDAFQGLFQSVISGQKSLKDAFNDFVNSIVATLSKLAAQNLAQALFGGGSGGAAGGGLTSIIGGIFGGGAGGGAGGAAGGAGGGLGSLFSSIFGGFRAAGGDVTAGTPYVVGEEGAEMFVPKVSGTIVPNHGSSGFGRPLNVVNHFTVQGNTTLKSQQQIAAMVGLSVNRAVRRNS